MYISGRTAVGLLGLTSISSGFPTSNSTGSGPVTGVNITVVATAVTNTTGNTTDTTAVPAPARPVIINANQGLNKTVTGIPTNITENANNTSFTATDKAKVLPFITGGPGPVVLPNDTWGGYEEGYPFWLDDPPKISRHPTPEERRSLAVENNKRDEPLPPRDRLLADHMEHYGQNLPECYKRCMRSEDGKSSIHMGQDNLGQICGIKWPLFAWWSEHHIYWCVNGPGGCDGHERHREAYRWLKWTCGDKPARV